MKLLFSFLSLFILSEAQPFFSWKIPLTVLSPWLIWESSGKFRETDRDKERTGVQSVIGKFNVATSVKKEVDHDREERNNRERGYEFGIWKTKSQKRPISLPYPRRQFPIP